MADLIRFVDSVVASPTLRLDLNDETSWWVKSFDAPPPRLRRSMAENAMRDGVSVGSSSYGSRTLTIELECRKSTQDLAATEIQKLWRELDRPDNWLMYQPTGATKPVFFRTFRSDASQLADVIAQQAMRTFTIEVLAESHALGLKETLGPFTVNNDPAAGSNGCYFDVTGVIGDVPTPLVWWDDASHSNLDERMIAVTHSSTATALTWSQAESMTLGTDTTNPGGGPDAAMSGTGTNNYRRTSFATGAASEPRLTWSITTPPAGTWRAVLFCRRSAATSTLQVSIDDNSAVTVPVMVEAGSVADRMVLDLGLITTADSGAMGAGYSATAASNATQTHSISASRSGGTDTLDFDAVLLLPAGGQSDQVTDVTQLVSRAGEFTVVDSVRESISKRSGAGDPTAGAGTVDASAETHVIGGFPLLAPNVTNRFVVVPRSNEGWSLVTHTLSVSLAYWPRYLFVRPSAT